ncbi:cell wall metabolism sensor histidine kinase WalK [Thalassobacillus sp. CUG 92003]|uniref:cell wall metabolism sensor histidine kinase WalK n=1 Tax=Thalassobacillus sp. CUG 92003 TaxID=2736641 RepID=UPI0015E66DDC|nr:cell wall metabolism sensor histidine kinase WalK [Thalassobacillus sp. CUG 92003]
MKKVGFFQSVRLKIILVYIMLLLLGIQVIGAYFADKLEENMHENFESSINTNLDVIKYSLRQAFENDDRSEDEPSLQAEVSSIIDDFNPNDIVKLQVVDSNSRVLASLGDPSSVGKKVTAPKVSEALLFGQNNPEEYTDPQQNRLWIGAEPIRVGPEEEVVGAIYYQADMKDIYSQLRQINRIFANGTLISLTITVLLGILVARTITKPLTEMRKQAQVMATGDFSQKVNIHGNDEIGQLGETFNDLNDKLKLSQATTEGERRKLSSVLSNMSDGVIATDRLGAIILMNAPASYLVGQSFEEVQGQFLIDVLNLNDEIANISEVEDAGSIIIDMSTDEQPLLLKANFSVVQDEYEEKDGFITVISDVTEQERIEQERREFVSNVSHELRTPLTTMRSYLEALTDGAWQDQEIAPRFLDVTQNETDRMIRLVNDLLQLSRMDNKEANLQKERVEYIDFFHNVIDRFEMNKQEVITFKRNLPDEAFIVWIDKDKVTQVLDNVISNAIKYSPEGGEIEFQVKKAKNRLQVSISDQGMGVPADTVDKIFDRFYRVDKARSRQVGGTGLGLAIAREIIEAHHGEIWAESQEGKGTTVFFTLPLISKKRRGNR